jgi:FkbM family methyltransferase
MRALGGVRTSRASPADSAWRDVELREMFLSVKSAAYSILDVLTRPVGLPRSINGRRWRLSAKCWRAFPGVWEAEVDAFFNKNVCAGSIVADVGAHVGIHTLGLAQRVGRDGHVFAFEPVPHVAALLRRHLQLNGLKERVTVVESAVGDTQGMTTMFVNPTGLDPGNSFVDRYYARRLKQLPVRMGTLDEFFRNEGIRPTLFKIDVEGYELRVLRGATELLGGSDWVTLACAVHPWHLEQVGDSEGALFEMARGLGLKAFDLAGRSTEPAGVYREIVLRKG